MNILFVHRDLPGQFGAISERLARSSHHRVVFLNSMSADAGHGYRVVQARMHRLAGRETHHYLRGFEADVLMGQAIYRECARLRAEGFVPDVVVAHCGWGVTLYLREIFPSARLIGYFEWYYHPHDSDADYLDPASMTADKACRIRTLNAPILMSLEDVDLGVIPTDFQRAQFPVSHQGKLITLHDGVDMEYFAPDPDVGSGRIGQHDFSKVARLVTYATRGLEPYRGFPQFMQAIDRLLQQDQSLHVAIAGEDRAYYSQPLPEGDSYKQKMLRELPDLPADRVHFMGMLPRGEYRSLLRRSALHIYLSVPFVPSWSLVEAMACGCNIVAADTKPVREIIGDEGAARFVDFRDVLLLEEVMNCALNDQMTAQKMRKAAQDRANTHYCNARLLPLWEEVICGKGSAAVPLHRTQV